MWGLRATLYEGEGGALCGALLPITVFLAVKAIGGPGLASWDRALAVSGRDEATCLPVSEGGSGLGGEGVKLEEQVLVTENPFVVGVWRFRAALPTGSSLDAVSEPSQIKLRDGGPPVRATVAPR